MKADEQVKAKGLTPFDYVKSIVETKVDLMVDEITEKSYVPFVINMNLSTDKECLIMMNEMNTRPHLSKRQQYDFLLNSITKKKRYLKYPKSTGKLEHVDMIKEYFQYNTQKALEVLGILTEEQLSVIKTKMYCGGRS